MKRIVLCFGGTWNTPADESAGVDDGVETNVRRCFRSVEGRGADGISQEARCNEGVGTEAPNELAGGAFGAGLDSHILEGYRHLVETYEEGDKDYDIAQWSPLETPRQVLEQRGFCGAHADVGGGHADRSLSDLSLRWMQDRAAEAGLGLSPVPLGPYNFRGTLTDSFAVFLNGLYQGVRPAYFRPVVRTEFGNEVLDPTIELRRRDATRAYRPENEGLPTLSA
ncbi:hypothetical protein OJF2_32230 [Aquisphaera giovannonii]|uniref:T6SS Phospholipase effector Tle1-like catalytic domain-containing protein n=1 Tax=Aquisphaera giovannonii TaxID=406548 RepID=A0A5B9W1Z4_9BACT|nr:DUF2235 domain-containing protein [Aquisphaera giovannonii]QEH34682.1 hypothetical protein OJF2_32230 [Aquisphaera giovannonii]